MFRTQFDRVRINCEPGSRMKPRRKLAPDDKGEMRLIVVAEDDLNEEIQSYRDECDIHTILARYQAGDTDIINQVAGIYADVSEFPKTYAEMIQVYERAKQEFASMTKETRDKFHNNFREYMSTAGSKEWFEKLGVFAPAPEKAEAQKTPDEAAAPAEEV